MKEPAKKLIKKMFLDNYENFIKTPKEDKKMILKEIDNLNSRLSIARNKLLSETIDDEEYIEIKKDCREKIEKFEAKFKEQPDSKLDIPKLIEQALEKLTNIWKLYSEGGIAVKREIIGSIFPEKLEFDGKHYRTTRINSIAHYIFQINNELSLLKKKRNDHFDHFSLFVDIN